MHKKIPKICTGCRVSEAKIYLYHSTEIAKARPHSEEWQTDTSVQKQWSMVYRSQKSVPTVCWLLFLIAAVAEEKCKLGTFAFNYASAHSCILPSL